MTMPDYPLLVFSGRTRSDRERRGGGGGGKKIQYPNADRQSARLAPKLQRLSEALENRRIALQNNPHGIEPEQVLVLETVGTIKDFYKAIAKVPGFEWLTEYARETIEPDDDFFVEGKPTETLKSQVFLVMSDQLAQNELLNLYQKWDREPDVKMQLGYQNFKHLFDKLYDIRPWGPEDRIKETGLLEDWQFRLQTIEDSDIPFEIELWYRKSPTRRRVAGAMVRDLISSLDGRVFNEHVIDEIEYHGLVGSISRQNAQTIVERIGRLREIELLRCEDIMFVRPTGQCAAVTPERIVTTDTRSDLKNQPVDEPLVALLDGMPLARHRLIDGRLMLDDPDEFAADYQPHEQVHGTAMSSLICLGDVNGDVTPVDRQVDVRPILKPRRVFTGQFFEEIPSDELPVDLIHRAIRRLLASDGDQRPVASSVKVVNLSICDKSRPFDSKMSPLARLIDWLSSKYQILFVISAGNYPESLELDIPRANLTQIDADEMSNAVLRSIAAETRKRRLLSPAEAINALTIGAAHDDLVSQVPGNLIDPFEIKSIPSVLNAHGPGYLKTVKPDLLMPGGRQLLVEHPANVGNNAVLNTSDFGGHRVADPGTQGSLNQTRDARGTSNAAALASRATHFVHETIVQLRQSYGSVIDASFDAVLLKALLAHGANWGDALPVYESTLKQPTNSKRFRDYVARFLGYGSAEVNRVISANQQRATVVGVGALMDGEADEFRLPLPPSLSAVTEKRKLTVTLAWFSPINSANQEYRVAKLWFNASNGIAPGRKNADHDAVQRGTLQHEVLEGEDVYVFQDGEDLSIKVNCRKDAGPIIEPVNYGLAVTLEVAEGIDLPIYEEIRDRLAVPIPIAAGP